MPTYEYACRACGHRFDIVQKMSDDPLVICPECGGELRKVFAPPAISFKGSGFYATDHGKKAKTSTGEGAKRSDEPDGKKTEPKGESAPKTGSTASTTTKEGPSK
jgi:putative FmdB family regulatory protein